ncbi:MAG: DUF4199 domain-containing protein [Hyphococcus sp.]
MTRIALIYGIIAGGIVIGITIFGLAAGGGDMGSDNAHLIGYLIMLVALSIIFVAVKRYRDQEHGGVIKFLPAFLLGLAIAGVAGIVYTLGWEVYLAASDYAFMEEYAASAIEAKSAAGVSQDELARFTENMQGMVESYKNPFFRLPLTFLEIFPVGLLIALVSAAVLRNPNVLPARG